jgi:hypothetical protein
MEAAKAQNWAVEPQEKKSYFMKIILSYILEMKRKILVVNIYTTFA